MTRWTIEEQPTWQPRNQSNSQPVTTELDPKLLTNGFPTAVSKAFQKAADELNCVIWSRVPGEVCTTLIDEGYNLKPFYVKGKSCNWGPMAGFVCQLPVFNKAGTSKMAYNLKEHINSLGWLDKIQTKEGGQNNVADSLFLPISISEARKQELLNSEFLAKHKIIRPGLIVGLARDQNETVEIEFLMKKKPAPSSLWDIYHRNIYIKDGDKYISYLKKNGDKFSIVHKDANAATVKNLKSYNEEIEKSIKPADRITISINDKVQIDQGIRELGDNPKESTFSAVKVSNPLELFYPIYGVQSPYLAYRDEAELYKNAVSGDYDLFAVWPFTPNISFEMTTRISEFPPLQPAQPNIIKNLFIPVEKKENALEISNSRNVFIEFVGTYQELAQKEDPERGNINDLVSLAAQTLNSLVQATYQSQSNRGQFPNRAFHSDEGGRPGVDEIEYPIAFFMPKSQWDGLKLLDVNQHKVLKNTAFVVENHIEFLSLVQLLKRRFYVFLHDGWVMHWMSLVAGKATLAELLGNVTLPDKSRKYFEARIREIDKLNKNGALNTIESLVQGLLTSAPRPATAALIKDFKNVAEHFVSFATYPQLPTSAERKDLILPLKIQ